MPFLRINPYSQQSQSARDRDSSSRSQSNICPSLSSNLNPSSSASAGKSPNSTITTEHSRRSNQPVPLPQSPPSSIVALKEGQYGDDDQDPDQLPISNVGREEDLEQQQQQLLLFNLVHVMRAFVLDLDLNLLLLLLDHLITLLRTSTEQLPTTTTKNLFFLECLFLSPSALEVVMSSLAAVVDQWKLTK
jgi:hypothetical protein